MPFIHEVKRHVRYPGEDVWYCPNCNTEHRTTDGTVLGQLHKRWEQTTLGEAREAITSEMQIRYSDCGYYAGGIDWADE